VVRTCRSSHVLKYKLIKTAAHRYLLRFVFVHFLWCYYLFKSCSNYFQVVRALDLIRDSWDAFGTKTESVYIPRGTLQVSILYSDSIILSYCYGGKV
jgi:hypothetical protein